MIRKDEYKRVYEEAKAKGETFFEHLLRDALVALLLLGLLAWMASYWKVPMEEVADPASTDYVPRPEWYFYFLFELLWLFPGKWIPVATFYIPFVGLLLFLLLPLYDRSPERSPLKRRAASLFATSVLVAMAFLTYQGAMAPAPPGVAAIPRGTEALSPDLAKGKRVYETQGCSACHVLGGAGSAAGPDLTRAGGTRDSAWLRRFIKNPASVKPGSMMPPYQHLSEEELGALSRFLASLK